MPISLKEFLQDVQGWALDFDGVGGDTEATLYDPLFLKYLQEQKGIQPDPETFARVRQNTFGKKIQFSAETLLIGLGVCNDPDDPNLEKEVAALLTWRDTPEINTWLLAQAQETHLIPDGENLFRHLVDQKRSAAIATSTKRELHQAKVTHHSWLQNMPTVTADDVAPDKRTKEEIYRAAAARLNLDPAACVAVEDAEDGVRGALATGMKVIIRPNPQTPPDSDLYKKLQQLATEYPERVLFVTSLDTIVEALKESSQEPRGGIGMFFL